VPVAYGVGSLPANRRTGLIAAALVACNPLLIWYSQEARSYEMLVLLTAVALLAAVRAVIAPTPRALMVWVGASILALATHYYAVLAIVPQSGWLLFVHRQRRPVRVAVLGVLACGAALIPLALAQNATGHDSWIANTSLSLRLAQIVPQFLIGTGAPDDSLLRILALVGAVGALGLLAARADPAERRPALLAGGLVLGGLAMEFVLIAAGVDDLITRNVIALVLPAVFLLAGGLGARRAGWLGLILTVVLCAVGVAAAAGVATDRNLQRPDWRLVARALGPAPPAGRPARVILIQHYLTLLPLSLYLHGLRHLGSGGAVVDQLDVISIRSPQERLCWWGAACNLIPSRMQSSYPVPGFRVGWRRQVRQFTILHLVASPPTLLRPRDIAPALRATRLPHDDVLVQGSGPSPPR
jgi:mannosyltransferase